MGNSASSSRAHHDDTVDYGFLSSQGVYTGPRDWNQQIVSQLIIERRLAPFYRPLEEYDDSWDDEQILAARKDLPDRDVPASDSTSRPEIGAGAGASRSNSINSTRRPGSLKEPSKIPEAMVYRDAVECPICFLYYPPNINHSRCCDQAICTECFVQIKRNEPTTTHVVSEPAACPYCVQENFGVTYTPPPWRAGIGAEGAHSPIHLTSTRASSQQSVDSSSSKDKGRRKSFSADSAEVVTIDQIRPDWEAKLAAVRAAVARRANRRIIMRQVGDRLIPVGVTSGRIHPLAGELSVLSSEQGGENSNENEGRGSRRSRRRQQQQQPQDINQLLGTMGLGGQDLEELMVMEAMRLSLLEHEEQQRREAEKKKKKEEAERAAKGGGANTENEAGTSSAASRLELPPIPTTSPIDAAQSSSHSLHSSDLPSQARGPSSFNSRSPSSISSSLGQAGSSERQDAPAGPSPLSATAALDVSAARSRSRSHSRSGSGSLGHGEPTPQARQSTDLSNAPPFSTLSAALAAHGAGYTIVSACSTKAPEGEMPQEDGAIGAQSSSSSAAPDRPVCQETLSAAPTVTTAVVVPAATNDSSTSLLSEGGRDQSQSRSYDELPSSPDSTLSHCPLLLGTPTAEGLDGAEVQTE